MKFHSEEYIQRDAEFGRILDLASKGAKQVLIVSPDKIDSLDDSLKYALDEKTAKELKKNRKATTTNSSGELIELYLETGKTKSDFKKGNILLPGHQSSTHINALKTLAELTPITFHIVDMAQQRPLASR